MTEQAPGYHLREIEKGELGEISKIREELEELEDAHYQRCRILALIELSDMYGAMEAYLKQYHEGFTMNDVASMSEVTIRAFQSGRRK